jgi:hypothetical protein
VDTACRAVGSPFPCLSLPLGRRLGLPLDALLPGIIPPRLIARASIAQIAAISVRFECRLPGPVRN